MKETVPVAVQCWRSAGMARAAAEPDVVPELGVAVPVADAVAMVVAPLAEPVDEEAAPVAVDEVSEADDAVAVDAVGEAVEVSVVVEAAGVVGAVDDDAVVADVALVEPALLLAAVPLPAHPDRTRMSASEAIRRLRRVTDFSLRKQQSAANGRCKKSADRSASHQAGSQVTCEGDR
jgi:hypothetical protein